MDEIDAFSIIEDDWLPALLPEGGARELSLIDIFEHAHDITELGFELPTQLFAHTRLLLAILHRALGPVDDPVVRWRSLWESPTLPIDRIGNYLETWSDRLDLLHPIHPFMQVADLRTASGDAGFDRFILDSTEDALFTVRRGAGLRRIGYAEAARWLVNVQSYAVSGIYPAALGDPRASKGKVYPLGTGYAGTLGGVLLEGRNLKETLLLNLVLESDGDDDDDFAESAEDRPVWERAPQTVQAENRVPAGPRGPADLFTWQSRRVRLVHDGHGVTGAVLCYGDELKPNNLHEVEPMSAWRRSEPQSRKAGGGTVYMPVTHRSERAVWRGMSALLPRRTSYGEGTELRPPRSLRWAGRLAGAGALPAQYQVRTRAIGVEYGTQSSVITEVIDDAMSVHVALLEGVHEDLAAVAIDAVSQTDQAVRALGDLAKNLDVAAGGGGAGSREWASRLAYDELDTPFRSWVSGLTESTRADDAAVDWTVTARKILGRLSEELVADAGTSAWVGREVGTTTINSAKASLWFGAALAKALPAPREWTTGTEAMNGEEARDE